MALNFKKWLLQKLGGGKEKVTAQEVSGEEFFDIMNDLYLRELAFWTCVNKIANALSKCEFKTYINGESCQKEEYYLWNIEPNKNQNAAVFLTKLIGKLYRDNEAIVIEASDQLLVADSYTKKEYAVYENSYKDVTVGDFCFEKTFYENEVLHFELNSEDMRKLVNGMYISYQKLLEYATKTYQRSRGSRGILNIDAMAQARDEFSEQLDDLMNNYFKRFFTADNAVLPLYEGYNYTDIGSKTYSNDTTRDIKAMTDDVFDFTARAFSFPPSLAKGDVQDTGKATDELLTFCIDPLARMLEKEINRKRNGKEGFLKGNYLKIDTTTVKHIDIFDIATPVDKLISSGAFTINDIRRVIGEPEIPEEWADQHFITKNYSTIQDLLESLDNTNTTQKGGENSE